MASDPVVRALARYDEPLLRAVAARLFKPRSHWPVEELVARADETLANTPVVDRRLKELPPSCRTALAVVGLSRRLEWPVGQLLEILATLGQSEGLAPLLALLDAGLIVPILPDSLRALRAWEEWLGSTPTSAWFFVPPLVAERASREGTGLGEIPSKRFDARTTHVADGLEWPLRLGVLWQQLRTAPVRLTQANALFKRDQTRLQEDALLSGPMAEQLAEVHDAGVLAMSMGMATRLFVNADGELRAGAFSAPWEQGLLATLAELWAGLPATTRWDPLRGYFVSESGDPFPIVALATLLQLAVQPEAAWTHPSDLAERFVPAHPSWSAVLGDADAESWMETMLLAWALPTRLVEATEDGEGWWVRLTAVGRHLLCGGPAPNLTNQFTRCLVVQPNADVIAYRQGLTPALIAKLSRFADWKTLGPACTLTLSAESVYRGLEAGLSMTDIVGVLQQHSGHPAPANVLDLIRRWAGKRERITVHAAATLLEFNTVAELDAALARGLVVEKLTDRIGLANGELDFKHFRLLGNRDYEAKPQRCVTFGPDGVTFVVELASADLLLEAEIARLAQPLSGDGPERRYRITPASARAARESGWLLNDLEQWCLSRSGEPMSASARLLFAAGNGATGELRRRLVLTFSNETIADGVCQWPDTADLLDDRLGPCSVSVVDENLEELLRRLAEVGVEARREPSLLATPSPLPLGSSLRE